MDTTNLVLHAKNGDQQAITELYYLSYKPAYAVAFKMTGNEDDAFDILQDAYIKAFSSLDQLTDPSGFIPWFNKITANKCRDFLRGKKNVVLFSDMTYDSDEDSVELEFKDESMSFQPEERADYSDTKRLVGKMLDNLPAEQKMVLLMYYVQDMSIKEIAEALGISESTVKSRMNYGKKKMRAQAEDMEKRGYKLRVSSVTVIPFLIWMLREFAVNAAVQPMSAAIGTAAGISAGAAAGTAAGTTAGTAAGTTAGAAVSAKAVALITAGAVAATAGAVGFFGFALPAMRGDNADKGSEVTPYSCTYDRGDPPDWQKRNDGKIYFYADPALWNNVEEIDICLYDNRYFDDNSSDLIGQIPLPMGGGMTDEGNNIWSYDFSANNFTLDDNETYIITFSAYWGLDFSTSFGKDYRTFDLIIGKDCFGDMVYLTGEKLEDEYFPYIAEWINADPAVYATPVRVTSEGNVNGELLPKGETFYSLFCTFVDRYSMGIDDSIPLNGKTQKQTVDDLAKTLGLTEEERDRALKETGFTEKNGSWERSSAP